MAHDEVASSILNRVPGGSILLMLPGSGLVVRTETMAKRAVSSGLRWFLGMGSAAEEPDRPRSRTEMALFGGLACRSAIAAEVSTVSKRIAILGLTRDI